MVTQGSVEIPPCPHEMAPFRVVGRVRTFVRLFRAILDLENEPLPIDLASRQWFKNTRLLSLASAYVRAYIESRHDAAFCSDMRVFSDAFNSHLQRACDRLRASSASGLENAAIEYDAALNVLANCHLQLGSAIQLGATVDSDVCVLSAARIVPRGILRSVEWEVLVARENLANSDALKSEPEIDSALRNAYLTRYLSQVFDLNTTDDLHTCTLEAHRAWINRRVSDSYHNVFVKRTAILTEFSPASFDKHATTLADDYTVADFIS